MQDCHWTAVIHSLSFLGDADSAVRRRRLTQAARALLVAAELVEELESEDFEEASAVVLAGLSVLAGAASAAVDEALSAWCCEELL